MTFKQITVGDYHLLKKFFVKQPFQLSTYSLFSIIVWSNKKLKTYFTIEKDMLVIFNKPAHAPEGDHLILPLSVNNSFSPKYLYDLAKEIGLTKYCFIPETYLEFNNRDIIESYFKVTEQPEYDDYIYLTEDLVRLKGNKYARQRNLIHQFDKVYLNKGRAEIEMISHDNIQECLEFLQKWCIQHGCDLDGNESLACEKMAAVKALNNLDRLESNGILIRIDGVVSAFGICSKLTEDMGVLNFEKAFSNIKGLYQFLDNECAKRLFAGYKYINKESDMSLPNLAQSKSSYNPVMKLKSYCLSIH